MRKPWLIPLIAVVAVLLASCAPAAQPTPTAGPTPSAAQPSPQATAAPKVLKIGAAVSLTGRLAREGKMVKDGYDYWMEFVNQKGGIKIGNDVYKIEIKYYDDESDAQTGARLTEKLITEDGIKLLLGPYSSGITQATAAIAEKYGALTVASEANADSIYERGYKMIVSVLPPASKYLYAVLEMGTHLQPKPATVAILSADDLFPLVACDGAKASAEKFGYQVVSYDKFPKDAKDLSTILTKLRTNTPDVVLECGYFETAVLMTKQSKDLKVSPKIMAFTVGPEIPDFAKSLGKDAEYMYGNAWWLPSMAWSGPVFGSAQEFAAGFQKRFGYEPGYHAASGTAAGLLLQLAIEKAGSTDPVKVREAFSTMDVETFWGPIAWEANGKNVKGSSGVVQIQNGKITVVWPEKIQQAKPIYPMPAWETR